MKTKTIFVALLFCAMAFSGAARAQERPAVKPIRVLLVLGGCCHDYAKQKDLLVKGISERANVEFVVAYDDDKGTRKLNPIYEKDDWAKGFDVILHDECTADVKDLTAIERILKPHKEGLPGVAIHCAMHSFRSAGWPKETTPWFAFTGLATTGHGPQEPIEVTYCDPASPITKGLENWKTIKEELYNNSTGKLLETAKPVATGKQLVKEKAVESVIVWTNTYNGKTRVFGTTLGHNNATVEDAKYMDLLTRGLLWSVDKLDDNGKPKAGYGK